MAAALYYALRMFAITAFYHRYFSHRSFHDVALRSSSSSRSLGATAVQRGPIWWASHHRAHHKHSDMAMRMCTRPIKDGFWWSHVGWILVSRQLPPAAGAGASDLTRFPELRLLDRFDVVVPLLTHSLRSTRLASVPGRRAASQTSGSQVLVWGFCISTIVTYHVTFSINSSGAPRRASVVYATKDQSRNNFSCRC